MIGSGFRRRLAWLVPTQAESPAGLAALDFEVDDLGTASAHAVQLGATVEDCQPQQNVRLHLDPAGHRFCPYVDN